MQLELLVHMRSHPTGIRPLVVHVLIENFSLEMEI